MKRQKWWNWAKEIQEIKDKIFETGKQFELGLQNTQHHASKIQIYTALKSSLTWIKLFEKICRNPGLNIHRWSWWREWDNVRCGLLVRCWIDAHDSRRRLKWATTRLMLYFCRNWALSAFVSFAHGLYHRNNRSEFLYLNEALMLRSF